MRDTACSNRIRIVAEYDMFGDMEGTQWMNLVLLNCFRENEIINWRVLEVREGLTWFIKFQVDVLVDEIDPELDAWAKEFIDNIVHDSDSRIISTEIIPFVDSIVFNEENSPIDWTTTPEYNAMFLRSQQNYANDLLHRRGHLFLNEVLDMLGIKRTSDGAITGWMKGAHVDFGVFTDPETLTEMVKTNEFTLTFNTDGVIFNKI